MISILVNGTRLEANEDLSMSFKKTNILFAFSGAEVERSFSFALPKTRKNERVFALSHLPANNGSKMRVKYAAEVQIDGVPLRGYLHAESYSDGEYSCVFYTGDLLGLQAVRDAGNIPDLIFPTDSVVLEPYARDPSSGQHATWEQVRYLRSGDRWLASMRVYDIIQAACAAVNVPIEYPKDALFLRLLPPHMAPAKETETEFSREYVAAPTTGGSTVVNALSMTMLQELFGETTGKTSYTIIRDYSTVPVSESYQSDVKMWVAKNDIQLSFDTTFPSNIFIGYFDDDYSALSFHFLGDYSFTQDANKTIMGDPLAGRSVDIPHGMSFVFVQLSDFIYNFDSVADTETTGWVLSEGLDVACSVLGEGDIVPTGQIVRLCDNLPNVTLITLLQAVAAVTGRVLDYTASEGIRFDTLDVSTWEVVVLREIIEVRDLQRRFSDYAKHNIVRFASDTSLLDRDETTLDYTVENANIPLSKDLQIIPFGNGGVGGRYAGRELVTIRSKEGQSSLFVLADAGIGGLNMARVGLPPNIGMERLCTASTSIECTVRMPFVQYHNVSTKTLLQVQGVRYVWTSSVWSDGVAKFNLSKI